MARQLLFAKYRKYLLLKELIKSPLASPASITAANRLRNRMFLASFFDVWNELLALCYEKVKKKKFIKFQTFCYYFWRLCGFRRAATILVERPWDNPRRMAGKVSLEAFRNTDKRSEGTAALAQGGSKQDAEESLPWNVAAQGLQVVDRASAYGVPASFRPKSCRSAPQYKAADALFFCGNFSSGGVFGPRASVPEPHPELLLRLWRQQAWARRFGPPLYC